KDVELKAGDSAGTVVVIGGSAKIHGRVQEAAVAILGNLEVEGEVGDAAVAVLGNIKAGREARIKGAAVAVGGTVDALSGANIQGQIESLEFPQWLKQWFVECVLKLRPLAPQVGWVWAVAAVFLLIYLLIATLFPKPVQACVEELTERPATTFLLGLLTKLLVPVVIGILGVTGIGLLVVPFISAALVLGALVGKTALLEYIGFRLGRQFGFGLLSKSVLALLVGALLITLLYMVPILGLLTYGVVGIWGLGVAVTAAFSTLRRELPERRMARHTPAEVVPIMASAAATASASMGGEMGGTAPAGSAAAPVPPLVPETLAYPKAGFWERMGAGFLDLVLVSLLGSLLGGPRWGLLVALAYFAGMWTWKGTTIGGIVLGLKVVRLEGQPVSFAVALVRALTAAFSVVVLFLGFLWIIWDEDKQAWHDKIAGTVVLRLPRGTPLVCL
ncbi:MAG TPA: RDD family protein, partial [Candidatus Sulfotelmatobacter sp.]|nr:RDD family protein [Candidatus Sulfotelmatobacter sp.]